MLVFDQPDRPVPLPSLQLLLSRYSFPAPLARALRARHFGRPATRSPAVLSVAALWIPFTIVAALGQVARNAMQRSLTGPLGTWGATNIRFPCGFPVSIVFFAVVVLVGG